MSGIRTTKKYYFTVEGETEKWYLDWLQEKINNEDSSKYKVSIDSKIQKNPLKRVVLVYNSGHEKLNIL